MEPKTETQAQAEAADAATTETTSGATDTAAWDLPYPPGGAGASSGAGANHDAGLREFLAQRGLTATASLARPRLLKELGAS